MASHPFLSTPSRRHVLALLAGLCATRATAQSAPPVHVLVAYPAGGPADVLARQLESTLRLVLARPVVIENVPGASGGLGVGRLLNAADARTTLLVGTPSETVLAPLVNPALTYRPEQLQLVGLVSRVPVALVGGPQLAATGLPALLAAARSADRPLSIGHYGVGSHAHIVVEDFSARAGITLLQVPYGGAAPAMRDLLGGQVDLTVLPFNSQVQDLVTQGRLTLFGMVSDEPVPRFPEAAVIGQLPGFEGFRHGLWTGAFVRRGAPARQADEIRTALHVVLGDPAFRRQKAEEGVGVAPPMTAGEAELWFDAEVARYRELTTRLAPRLGG